MDVLNVNTSCRTILSSRGKGIEGQQLALTAKNIISECLARLLPRTRLAI